MSSLHGLLEQNTKAKHIIKIVLKRFHLCQAVGFFSDDGKKKRRESNMKKGKTFAKDG